MGGGEVPRIGGRESGVLTSLALSHEEAELDNRWAATAATAALGTIVVNHHVLRLAVVCLLLVRLAHCNTLHVQQSLHSKRN